LICAHFGAWRRVIQVRVLRGGQRLVCDQAKSDKSELEHVPPGLNRGFPWRGSISESIGIDSLGGAGRCRRPIQQT
jgi:hypothetical protein